MSAVLEVFSVVAGLLWCSLVLSLFLWTTWRFCTTAVPFFALSGLHVPGAILSTARLLNVSNYLACDGRVGGVESAEGDNGSAASNRSAKATPIAPVACQLANNFVINFVIICA